MALSDQDKREIIDATVQGVLQSFYAIWDERMYWWEGAGMLSIWATLLPNFIDTFWYQAVLIIVLIRRVGQCLGILAIPQYWSEAILVSFKFYETIILLYQYYIGVH